MRVRIVIRPDVSFPGMSLGELWRYRDLLLMFVRRNIVAQYKQTILGPLWYVIQPVMTVVMYMLVFGHLAGIPTDGVAQPLFYLAGTCVWSFFADCLNKTSSTFVNNAPIFGKVYFPRMIIPLANCITNLLRFGIQFALFIAVYAFYGFSGINVYALLFPVLVLVIAVLALGFGTLVTSLTTKYRDLQILFSFVVSLWMFATPIVYPLSQAAGKTVLGFSLYKLMILNPVTPVIEAFKYGFLGAGEFVGWGALAYSAVFAVAVLLVGVSVFNRVERNFMDTV